MIQKMLSKPSGQTFKMEQAATHFIYKPSTWCHNTKIHEINLQHRENPRPVLLNTLLGSLKLSFTVH